MLTLYQETLEAMKKHGKGRADVVFIGSETSKLACTWHDYMKISKRKYKFGQLAIDLIIGFRDGSKLVRGHSNWELCEPFPRLEDCEEIQVLFSKYQNFATLRELHE